MGSVQFNPPPGWPEPPPGWLPPAFWNPPRHWPTPPAGWEFFWEEPAGGSTHSHRVRTHAPAVGQGIDPGYLTRRDRTLGTWRAIRSHRHATLIAVLAVTLTTLTGLVLVSSNRAPVADLAAACQAHTRAHATATAPLEGTASDAVAGVASRGLAAPPAMRSTTRVIDAGERSDGTLTVTLEVTPADGTPGYTLTCAGDPGDPHTVIATQITPVTTSGDVP